MAGLAVVVWAGVGYLSHLLAAVDDIPEYDSPESARFYAFYGHVGNTCELTVHGDRFLAYRGRYRLAVACLVTDGSRDISDVPVAAGSPHDIVPGDIALTVYMPLASGNNFFALLIPPNVDIAQFTTLRQARSVGVKIKWVGGQGLAAPG